MVEAKIPEVKSQKSESEREQKLMNKSIYANIDLIIEKMRNLKMKIRENKIIPDYAQINNFITLANELSDKIFQ